MTGEARPSFDRRKEEGMAILSGGPVPLTICVLYLGVYLLSLSAFFILFSVPGEETILCLCHSREEDGRQWMEDSGEHSWRGRRSRGSPTF